ncbi:MAG: LTA synthase family protein, partial [Verrucomicrobiota bacterium]
MLAGLLGWALLVGTGTRLALWIQAGDNLPPSSRLALAFVWGAVADAATALVLLAPVAVLLALPPARFFQRTWARGMAHAGIIVYIAATLFVAVAEVFFWDEFGVRFNFIAVDYLIYTQEVLGNIRESYPMGLILGGLALVTAVIYLLWVRGGRVDRCLDASPSPFDRWRDGTAWLLGAGVAGAFVALAPTPDFPNAYAVELVKNGPAAFVEAFRANQLDYERFYPVQPIDAAFAQVRGELGLPAGPRDLLRTVAGRQPERRLNVIQITVESLSAEFLTRYGQKRGLTPNLDALVSRSLVFDRLYATGNRTDRGMEALTLSVPPTPGRSLIKRPDNENLFTLGSVLAARGYATAFLYGGYGYFDNMNYFFGQNGYRIVDRAAVPKSEVTFANAWGACDEDLLRWTLREADRDHAAGTPFFHFVMTTSNHRPYTYPEGRIDLPSKVSRRAGAVKYTDYAIGEFLRAASTHPWYRDTVFVIVADHCASSAGKTNLPVNRYHIPMLIFAPGGQIAHGVVDTLCSQIDYAPTLLGLLGGDYPSRFFGRDLLDAEA